MRPNPIHHLGWAALIVCFVALFGCGDDEPDVLHLNGFDISTEDYEAGLTATLAGEPVGAEMLCKPLVKLESEKAQETYLLEFFKDIEPSDDLMTGAVEVPDQEADPESISEASKIIVDVCESHLE